MSTPEYREKRRMTAKEVASRPEWRRKQSLAHKGKKRPPEVGRKVSEAKKGHKVTEETRRKLSEANRGPKSRFWKGGISDKSQLYLSSSKWQNKSLEIKKRDGFKCQACGWTIKEASRLSVHHIVPRRSWLGDLDDYPDGFLVTLCNVCHAKTEQQKSYLKVPINGRGENARLDRLRESE
ncbi:MAG: HNH endonuclease [Candidatus Thorarchaeota archaeon]